MRMSIAGVGALALVVWAGTADAQSRKSMETQETGVASIHAWTKVGRKTCMVDHFHDGSGTGRNKKEAEAAAIRAWADFTAWEYGTPWARYAIAESRSANCSQQSPSSWSCAVQARACRPY
jgi:Neuraminidase (sialidase)